MADWVDAVTQTFANLLQSHGPSLPAAAHSFAPGDYSVHFFLQLGLILISCRALGWLGTRFLAQPQVVGEMIAGVLLGPSLFGLLFPALQLAVFPPQTKSILYAGSQLGVGLYMFLVGTTLRVEQLHAKARSAVFVSLAGIGAPFLISIVITPYLMTVPGLFAYLLSVFGKATRRSFSVHVLLSQHFQCWLGSSTSADLQRLRWAHCP